MARRFRRTLDVQADLQSESARIIFHVNESSRKCLDEHPVASHDLGRQQQTDEIGSLVEALGRQGHAYTWR